ncbi:sigma-70 family RNA polymerase sigma factor (plasmid) [Paenibacillus polymyxa]|uniref:RNA polymerase factor sigma-70 n=1 Tax=Paenibacillus polymyxa TaxID=1406 RepID=A0A379LTE3_PAEPO|nr:sigma-70 family RNA polymerase sigma factor [Paenibacillus polymyxa]MBE7901088.1 sigma-70 family RNA polymerase sigma factor [Paenibacillus polymyxa]MBG9764538.1 hypothetical protein [Paenibacillus polymyxa]MCC3261672.1 sigma-70 family RNA polymerase sigma factor [Paenibacillus polymyxa]QPK56318.1 sigma-70 family RNA polymerase sigma factor [Paenibacillus polymyxa]QPK61335.1 sigma-70 family RNA polymerase sigma factor [Paenibacillus polymyxa]
MSTRLEKMSKRLGKSGQRETVISLRQAEKKEWIKRIRFNNKKLADEVLIVEKKWAKLAYELDDRFRDKKRDLITYPIVRNLLEREADRWSRTYRNKRLTREDFLSKFYETAWLTIEKYSWIHSTYLYIQIRTAIKSCAKDMLRAIDCNSRYAFHSSLSLAEGFEDFYPDASGDLEDVVMERIFQENLSTQDKGVWRALCEGQSQRETAKELGKHRKTVSNSVARIKNKYNEFYKGMYGA